MEITPQDVYKLYLQAILSRGILSEEVAQLLMQKCRRAVLQACDNAIQVQDVDWDYFVQNVNALVDKLDFEFRPISDENTGAAFYALVNRKGDDIAQVATDYTPAEIAFFKAVVELIMDADNFSYSVSSLAALREIPALKLNFAKSQGEILLSSFVAKGWLNRSKRGRYTLAMRSMLELLPYLKSTFGEDALLECLICKDALTRGVACHQCRKSIHYHCFAKYKGNKESLNCPNCRGEWPLVAASPLVYIGEEAAPREDSGRRRTRQQTEDSDGGIDEDEAQTSDEDEPTQPQRTQVKKEKKTGSRKSATQAENVEMNDEDGSSQAPRRSSRRG
ncbi:hypothetical protein FA15DRAFT_663147 [Coprinopsis marcescibilis]|uniref:Non-structural maintenance of chromosomes element 1 homolog n=1 Tax=Coprinopsis marcescibilis TaxID=230819 RepID=A0A5C3LBQ9_COPMA|nr:hypothetical protein FA15DRAFT_663147 [Coprinopsis marcescibilis]